MSKDYKNRARGQTGTFKSRNRGRHSGAFWRWFAVFILGGAFAGGLFYMHQSAQKVLETGVLTNKTLPATLNQAEKKISKPDYPHFDFYHSLSKKEIVIPEHEVKTRSREELVGKNKGGQYLLLAGSFVTTKEAEAMAKKLSAMGIQSKIDKIMVKANKKLEKSKLDSKTWYRVKIGPYNKISSLEAVKIRLKKSKIDVMVTELGH